MYTFSVLGVLGIEVPAVISHQMQYYCSQHNHYYAPDKNLSEYDISQPRESYTGEQKRFMQAVGSHGYGGVSHPSFKLSS